MSFKLTEDLCMKNGGLCYMKNDAKFEDELTCRFKIDMPDLTICGPITQ